ncbi:MAG: PA0069 family radical SAM protein [Alphaproteobacteria bacterium]|nr:PA0069 family radical SAM protein [Alphaproteobacteria bacterium]
MEQIRHTAPSAADADLLPERPRKGRGAVGNQSGRYERETRHLIDDGWGTANPLAGDPPPLKTTVSVDASRTVLARNTSPDIPFDRSINAYRGCEHGCVYCYARPTHAWMGLSPGLDFETKLFAKPNAPALLRTALAGSGYQCAPIAMGTNTDPYQPIERDYRITRGLLKVLDECSHPLTIVTKSALVLRDLDILSAMAKRNLVKVSLSVTTLDRGLSRRMEPRAATPVRRLETIEALARAGVPTGVMAAPMIPALNDHEMESILEAAAQAGASEAGYILLRLPLEIKTLFREWLEAHKPDKAKHVFSLVRQTRGGELYKAKFGERMKGEGPYAALLKGRFDAAIRRLGLNEQSFDLDTASFAPPAKDARQMSLL